MLYKGYIHVGSGYVNDLTAQTGGGALHRLPIIASAVGSRLLKATGPVNLLFYFYTGAVLLNVKRLAWSPALVLHVLLAAQMTAYVATYMITNDDLVWHLSTALSRLLLHLVPLALLATAIHTFEWVRATIPPCADVPVSRMRSASR